MAHARRQDARLARAGAGEHEDGALEVLRGFALFGVQAGQVGRGDGFGHRFGAEDDGFGGRSGAGARAQLSAAGNRI